MIAEAALLAGAVLASSGLITVSVVSASKTIAGAIESVANRYNDRQDERDVQSVGQLRRVAIAAEAVVNDKPVQQENTRLENANRNLSGAALAVIEGDAPVEPTMREDVAVGVTLGWSKAGDIMGEALRARTNS